jgi:predicted helicase
LWRDYPGRWGRDCGVDLVFRHKNGQTWAVQAKCYSPSYEITKLDVDKFLSESNRKVIDHRLLIATTDRLGANAKQVIEAQEKPVVKYLRTQFDNAAVEYPDNINDLSLGKRRDPRDPYPYQRDAIESVVAGFQAAERGQLIMACGTGKTLVSLCVKERLDANRTLVLVPSLNLLSQILNEWTAQARVPFDVLCVCSDLTAGKREDEEDEAISSVSDLAFPVTDPDPEIARREIVQFLKGSGHRVIFSTYHSSPLIADAQQDSSVPCFDLIVADEAHRCAGKVDSAFATVLDATKLRSKRRLFATATPRTYRRSLKEKAGEIGVEVVDMYDEAVFGKRLHVVTFGEAIKNGWLTDYRVVIVGVDDETIADWIRRRLLVATDAGVETDAQSLAAEIGLIKAIRIGTCSVSSPSITV